MASVKSVTIISDAPWQGGKRKRRYEITLTDNSATDHVFLTLPVKVDAADDGLLLADKHLQARKKADIASDDLPTLWSDSQADYDRRSLGFAMTIESTDLFYTYLPLFKAMETRGGANANQRSSYLGVARAEYDLMSDRFGDVEGIAFFLDDAKGQVWDEVKGDWQ